MHLMRENRASGRLPSGRPTAIALYAALALLLTSRVLPPADDFGDPSFQQALGYFLAEGLQAGEDYIFTYGPLGHFLIPRYHPGLFWLDWAVGLAMGLVAAWPVFAVLRAPAFGGFERAAVVAAFVLSAYAGPGPETPYLMAGFVMLALIRRDAVRHPVAVGAFAAALAFLSLGKFTLMVLAVGFVGYLALQFAADRRFRDIAVVVLVYPAALLGFWLLAGQDVSNFPRFVTDSIEISRAYSAGMFLEGSTAARVLGVLAVIAALAATLPFLPFEPRRMRAGLDAVFVLVFVFILWKSGMVRQNGHEVKLFLPAMLVPLLIAAPDIPSPLAQGLRRGAVALGLAVGAAGHLISAPQGATAVVAAPFKEVGVAAYQTALPWMRLNALEQRWWELGIYESWKKTAEYVDGRTIDMFPPEHRVLLIGGFNYRPRYVFQGYQACTPELLDANGAAYWGTGSAPAPEFVLYRSMPIDHRFPYMEDSQALLALYYAYEPVLLEKGLVLFQRRNDPPQSLPEPDTVAEGTLRQGETLPVPESPGRWQLLSLDFNQQSASLLSRGAGYTMTLEYADGRTAEYRVLPALAGRPFLLNRYWDAGPVRDNNDYREDRVTSLSLSGGGEWEARYRLLAVDPPEAAKANSENEGV
jgi:hypothetical protein